MCSLFDADYESDEPYDIEDNLDEEAQLVKYSTLLSNQFKNYQFKIINRNTNVVSKPMFALSPVSVAAQRLVQNLIDGTLSTILEDMIEALEKPDLAPAKRANYLATILSKLVYYYDARERIPYMCTDGSFLITSIDPDEDDILFEKLNADAVDRTDSIILSGGGL